MDTVMGCFDARRVDTGDIKGVFLVLGPPLFNWLVPAVLCQELRRLEEDEGDWVSVAPTGCCAVNALLGAEVVFEGEDVIKGGCELVGDIC